MRLYYYTHSSDCDETLRITCWASAQEGLWTWGGGLMDSRGVMGGGTYNRDFISLVYNLIEEKRYALFRYLIVIVLVKHNEKSSFHASLVTRWTFKQNFISLATASHKGCFLYLSKTLYPLFKFKSPLIWVA